MFIYVCFEIGRMFYFKLVLRFYCEVFLFLSDKDFVGFELIELCKTYAKVIYMDRTVFVQWPCVFYTFFFSGSIDCTGKKTKHKSAVSSNEIKSPFLDLRAPFFCRHFSPNQNIELLIKIFDVSLCHWYVYVYN